MILGKIRAVDQGRFGGAAKGIAFIAIAAGTKLELKSAAGSGHGFCTDGGASELGSDRAFFAKSEPAQNDGFVAIALLFGNFKAPVARAKTFVKPVNGGRFLVEVAQSMFWRLSQADPSFVVARR